MLIIGLTGGIASGKNSVSTILAEFGARIIDADIICRELVEPGKPAWREIVSTFGRDVLKKNNEINRKKLGEIIFNAPEKRDLLNSILHPRAIREEWRRIARIERDEPDALVVVNAALLIESGNYRDVDRVVVVAAEGETMIRRMMKRDGVSRDEAILRINAQMPMDEKIKHADYIIENNGSMEELRGKVIELYRALRGRGKTGPA